MDLDKITAYLVALLLKVNMGEKLNNNELQALQNIKDSLPEVDTKDFRF